MLRRRVIKINALTQAQMVKLLIEGLYTSREIAEQTGLHYATVCQYSRELHRAGAAHICAWQPDARDRDAHKIYKIGQGKDAKRRRLSASDKQRRFRASKAGRVASVFLLGAAQERVRSPLGAEASSGEAPGVSGGPRKAPRKGRPGVLRG